MQSLQSITDAWGNWIAAKHKTTMKYTASTNYGAQSTLAQYTDKQVTATYQNISYMAVTDPVRGQNVLDSRDFNNGTNATQSQTVSFTKETSSTFNWSVTEAISIGNTVEVGVMLPEVLSAKGSTSTNLSLSSTQGAQVTNTQSWTFSDPVVVPPQSTVEAVFAVNFQTYNMNFVASVLLAGSVAVWFNKQVTFKNKPHNLFFFSIADVFNDVIANNLISTKGYALVPDGVTTAAKGTLSGSQGIKLVTNIKQFPLNNTSGSPISSHEAYGDVQSPAT